MFRTIAAIIIVLFFGSIPAVHGAGLIDLPRTGQTGCYDAKGKEVGCRCTGQDGDVEAGVAWPNPRFTAGADREADCMKDNLTGLMWPKNGNLPGANKDWTSAIDYANAMSLCGHADWRLPNLNEIESLVNAGEVPPVWLKTQGFTNVQLSYLSSTTSVHESGGKYAWDLALWIASLGYDLKTKEYPLWPVRGDSASAPAALWRTGQLYMYSPGDDGDLKKGVAWPEPRFADQGNGEVLDKLTGLTWTKDAHAPGPLVCGPATGKEWQDAFDYVKCLNEQAYLGHADWRLPNRKELISVIDRSQYYPALPVGHPFTNVRTQTYFSSTTMLSYLGGSLKYCVDLADGYLAGCTGEGSANVWPVRGGEVRTEPLLAVSKLGSGSGTVSSNPSGLDCGSTCTVSLTRNTPVTLAAAPAQGSTFTGWSGACTGKGTCKLTMKADRCVGATFASDTARILTVAKGGYGSGTVTSNPSGINCGSTCTANFKKNGMVTLTAAPASGSHFAGWSGACQGAGICKVAMNADKSVAASFGLGLGPTLTVSKSGTGAGTVTSAPSGIDCGSTCSASFTTNTVVTLAAAPLTGSYFTGWSGACKGVGVCKVTMSAAKAVGASFTANPILAVTKSGFGTVTSTPAGINCGSTCSASFTKNASVSLAPLPQVGYAFTRWTEACGGAGACRVAMTTNKTVGAVFSPATCTYTLTPPGKAFTYKAGSVTVAITARGSTNCAIPSVTKEGDWIAPSAVTFDKTKGSITISVSANTSSAPRSGKVIVGGRPFQITQGAAACTLALSPTASPLLSWSEGAYSFSATTNLTDCAWTAKTASPWVILPVTSGAGSGIFNYEVKANTAGARSGAITMTLTRSKAARTFAVRQGKR